MISSLLSLYIATTISPQPNNYALDKISRESEISTASIENKPNHPKKPQKNPYYISPIINARSGIAIDLESGGILFEKAAHDRLPIASITKLMTILIVLEENDKTELVTVSSNAATTEGSKMFLRSGEKITLENLIYGALIHSANDAAIALAEHNAGNTQKFVQKMNQRTLKLGLLNTHFANPAGLDHPDNYSSAYDIAILAKELLKHDKILEISEIKAINVKSIDGKIVHKLMTTNELLDSYLNVKGLKTGSTQMAGLCLVAISKYQNKNVLTVLLNSPARFRETKILLDWTFRAFNW